MSFDEINVEIDKYYKTIEEYKKGHLTNSKLIDFFDNNFELNENEVLYSLVVILDTLFDRLSYKYFII